MGCVNGKPVLSDEDLDFIANHTAVSRDEVDKNYQNFLSEHPNGKITRREFRNMMQVCTIFKAFENNLKKKIFIFKFSLFVLYFFGNRRYVL